MSEIIFSRDADGVTKMGNNTFKVPTDRSAISILSTNGNYGQDGEDMRGDGWVYCMKTGVRLRKWFVRFVGSCSIYREARIWEPKLEDIAKLESRRWHYCEKAGTILQPMWPLILNKIKEAGHFGGYHKFSETGQGYLEFNKYPWQKDRDSVGWDWCKKGQPLPVINQPLTDEWFHYEWLCSHYHKPFYLYNEALLTAIDRKFFKLEKFSQANIKLHLIINGRHYWLARSSHQYDERFFERIAFPEDTHSEHIIGA